MSAVETLVGHDWRLVAPWWHWPRRDDPGAGGSRGRFTRPVLQKYDTPDLVNTFLRDPQLRLQLLDAADRVAVVTRTRSRWSRPTSTTTELRKLYLPTHHRNYLVVCSLHCLGAGFPVVGERAEVCEAGFVVRRRTYDLDDGDRAAAVDLLRRSTVSRARMLDADRQLDSAKRVGVPSVRLAKLDARRSALGRVADDAAGRVRTWARDAGVKRALKGWIPSGLHPDGSVGPMPACPPATGGPSPLAGVGRWRDVGETPTELQEATFPLYPLVPDPTQPDHDGAGAAAWFGVVPTGSADLTFTGRPRFDDTHVYEIRCFVRRHRAVCPRTGPQCTCPIVWSEPTEPYQLASHFDLQGTANRPVTVQLPDIKALQADANRLGPGRTGGVRMKAPANSNLMFDVDTTAGKGSNGGTGGPEICTFAIPLITIVATFVFKLFMPIVIFLFQLWFLLSLRFCIPPEISIDAGFAAALDALPPDLQIDASAAASFDATWGSKLDAAVNAAAGGMKAGGQTAAAALRSSLGPAERLRAQRGIIQAAAASGAGGPPDRVFALRVRRDEVVAG